MGLVIYITGIAAVAFINTCKRFNIPAALERSRSGNGAHIWIFFEKAIPAAIARKLGAWLLTETMESNPQLGLDSYDRFFPNQDTLPRSGFGNLIALPLQKFPRNSGNSAFIDKTFKVIDDQWDYLSKIQKLSQLQVEHLVAQAEKKGGIIGVRLDVTDEPNPTPWKILPPPNLTENIPEHLSLIVSNEIYIEKNALPPALLNRFIRLSAFQNPEFYKAQAMRLPVYDKPRIISCAHDYPHHIGLPRGCLEDVTQLLKKLKIRYSIQEELNNGAAIETNFQGQLRTEQEKAVKALLSHDLGILSATTAFGKTVVAAYLIASRKVNTLIIVHTKQLQGQWHERLQTFLNLPAKNIGRLGAGRKKKQLVSLILH